MDFDDGDQATVELDLYAGYTNTVFDALTYDVGFLYYAYPGASSALDYDYWEVYLGLGYDFGFASVSGNVAWAPTDFFAGSDTGLAVYGGVEVPVPLPDEFPIALAATAEVGHQSVDDNATFGTPDWTWWSIGASAEVTEWGLGLSLQYVDTSLSRAECFGGADLCTARVVGTASLSF